MDKMPSTLKAPWGLCPGGRATPADELLLPGLCGARGPVTGEGLLRGDDSPLLGLRCLVELDEIIESTLNDRGLCVGAV